MAKALLEAECRDSAESERRPHPASTVAVHIAIGIASSAMLGGDFQVGSVGGIGGYPLTGQDHHALELNGLAQIHFTLNIDQCPLAPGIIDRGTIRAGTPKTNHPLPVRSGH